MVASALPSAEYLLTCFDYDKETGALTWRRRPSQHFPDDRAWRIWRSRYEGKPAGYLRRELPHYIRLRLDGKSYYAHRIIWKLVTGDDPIEIDHKDGNGLNNRWSNLRPARRDQNSWNRGRQRGRDLPKGVHISNNWYIATAQRHGQKVFLGNYRTKEEAHAAYCAFVEEIDGIYFHDDRDHRS